MISDEIIHPRTPRARVRSEQTPMAEEPEPEADPSFEQALGQLERIVANLERGEPELTSALAKYETGVRLLTLCYRLVDQAELSIALLTGVDEEGNPVTTPFDATASIARDGSSAAAANPEFPSNRPKKRRPPQRPSSIKDAAPTPDDPDEASDPPF